MFTAPLRPWPDFLIIGTKRGGTTSLYRYLEAHPAVLSLVPSARYLPMQSNSKGVRYFDTSYHRSRWWYRAHFPTTPARALARRHLGMPPVVGEASPYYLFHPLAAERAAAVVGNARIIVLLRDPVERTYSHYAEQRRIGAERLSFEEALLAEPERLAGEVERMERDARYRSHAHQHQSYLAQSRYADSLRRWLERFPADRVLVLCSEEFFAEPEHELGRVHAFLGLSHQAPPDTRPWNAMRRAPMRAHVRRRLEAELADDVRDVERLIGRSLPWPWAEAGRAAGDGTAPGAAVGPSEPAQERQA
jgi:hypothetical protein